MEYLFESRKTQVQRDNSPLEKQSQGPQETMTEHKEGKRKERRDKEDKKFKMEEIIFPSSYFDREASTNG